MKQNKNKVPEHFFIQSGVIPFRMIRGKIEVLLITSRKKRKWIFPKGVVEAEIGKKASAEKEALEEAGVVGKIVGDSVGEFLNEKWDGMCRVVIYPMEVMKTVKHWEEESFRNRKWFTLDEALESIYNKELKRILRQFKKNMPR